ncbi:hypothetical protein Bca52824_008870 [Brassica carinata]|uniref:Neprosin PEP catalytic domain-containing protein n=1 Tax=Brassica carinata TaxID=52824 RepID=A0A8X8B9M6_BRACI|nr:hypothetical protein Bca52824_008870 [Brassica carinata]
MGMAGFIAVLMLIGVIISPCVYGRELSDHQEIEVERLLKGLNKPALKSIKSEDGDIIDCVPIYSQPAFDHPLLKNHTIQMRPNFIPKSTSMYTKTKTKATQVCHKNGRCPENTVPIRRTKKEDIIRSKSIESFGKKTTSSIPEDTPSTHHEYAIMNSQRGKYFGTKFAMNVWNPEVQIRDEFSLAQTWLVSGDGPNLNTIEAGLQVYPGMYGDNNIRLFVFWTTDDYKQTRCYNVNCNPGFVQRSNSITVGGAYTPVSQYDGEQYELSVLIWKVNEELVGYWPGSLFTSLGDGATIVQWGGEIVNFETDGKHTSTDMGSGHFADEGFRKASYFRNIMTVDGTNTLSEPQGVYPTITNDNCYNVKAGDGTGTSWGLNFFYGGPGQNAKCP